VISGLLPLRLHSVAKKKPDIIVEKAIRDQNSTGLDIHAVFELKKEKGDRFEKPLAQLTDAITFAVDELGNEGIEKIEVFAVVIAGTDIGFFEYHNDRDNLCEEDIPNFRGCVSLTQSYQLDGQTSQILPNNLIPRNLRPIFFDAESLRNLQDEEQENIGKEAKIYITPSVFSILEHQAEIEAIFKYTADYTVRSSV
jgi:hypothetical protein